MAPNNKKKANATTEVVVGSAAAKLNKGLAELKGTVEELQSLNMKAEDMQLAVVAGEERIKELETEFNEKLRAHNVEFELKVRENSLNVVREVLDSQQMVAVPKQELEQLRKELEELLRTTDERVKKEVGQATGIITARFDGEKKLLEAEYKAKEAQNLASIESLKTQVTSLQEQITMWKGQLDSEREASVKRAQAGSIGTLNVGGQEARR